MPPTINVNFLIYTFFETVLKIPDHDMFLVLRFSNNI